MTHQGATRPAYISAPTPRPTITSIRITDILVLVDRGDHCSAYTMGSARARVCNFDLSIIVTERIELDFGVRVTIKDSCFLDGGHDPPTKGISPDLPVVKAYPSIE